MFIHIIYSLTHNTLYGSLIDHTPFYKQTEIALQSSPGSSQADSCRNQGYEYDEEDVDHFEESMSSSSSSNNNGTPVGEGDGVMNNTETNGVGEDESNRSGTLGKHNRSAFEEFNEISKKHRPSIPITYPKKRLTFNPLQKKILHHYDDPSSSDDDGNENGGSQISQMLDKAFGKGALDSDSISSDGKNNAVQTLVGMKKSENNKKVRYGK